MVKLTKKEQKEVKLSTKQYKALKEDELFNITELNITVKRVNYRQKRMGVIMSSYLITSYVGLFHLDLLAAVLLYSLQLIGFTMIIMSHHYSEINKFKLRVKNWKRKNYK